MLLGAFQAAGGPPRYFPGAGNQEFATVLLGLAAIAREKPLKPGGAQKLNLIRTINPEFKDLAQTWEWKMSAVREKTLLSASLLEKLRAAWVR
jgi:hypothetical protein